MFFDAQGSGRAGGSDAATSTLSKPSQVSSSKCALRILHSHVQVGQRDGTIRVADGISDLGKSSATDERVREKRMPSVVNRKHCRAFGAK